jgi:hypothetical protein
MLVKFESEAGSVTMFGEVALTLLKMMGHSGTVPSALLAKDIPAAVTRLKSALSIAPAETVPKRDQEDEGKPNVSLQQRAYPLIEMMERAAQRGADITWKAGG